MRGEMEKSWGEETPFKKGVSSPHPPSIPKTFYHF